MVHFQEHDDIADRAGIARLPDSSHLKAFPSMLAIVRLSVIALCLSGATSGVGFSAEIASIKVDPPSVKLVGPLATFSLMVSGTTTESTILDRTLDARYSIEDGQIATVDSRGVVRGLRNGKTSIIVEVSGQRQLVPLEVVEADRQRTFHFENDIAPLLTRFSCNSSGCHGKAEGQNGFKLSVFGFDPQADYAALLKEGRGRRLMPSAPDRSLLLSKASGQVPHGGGMRIPRTSEAYQILREWIASGAPLGSPDAPTITHLRVEPSERILQQNSRQALRVIARFSDNIEIDVTRNARFQTNSEEVASVNVEGIITTAEVTGDVGIMAAYKDHVAVFRGLVPRREQVPFATWQPSTIADEHVAAKWKKLNIVPSEMTSDEVFLRRAFLDIIGTLPTSGEVRTFLKDQRPDKREKLVDVLLDRPEYADFWAMKWSDLLRVDRGVLGHRQAYGYYRWIRDSFRSNKPFDQFVRELLVAEGPLEEAGPANFYRVVTKPGEMAGTLTQVFLGVRIACAECHHHPFDRWSQSDYYGMQGFFTQVGVRKIGPIDVLTVSGDPVTVHPRTGVKVPPTPLGADASTFEPSADRRRVLAAWMTSPENKWFARNLANRYVAHFWGRGLIEPVDDVRLTNPPTNPELLDALAKSIVDSRFDVKQLIRLLTTSKVYQLSTKPNATNRNDTQNYSRATYKLLDAEVAFDMICQTTDVPEKFTGFPLGTRAIQVWDNKSKNEFLTLFGRPPRATSCPCERTSETTLVHTLHFLNAVHLHERIAHENGMVVRLEREIKEDGKLIDELFLTFLSRYPTEEERTKTVMHVRQKATTRRQGAEDISWVLLNMKEFRFNR